MKYEIEREPQPRPPVRKIILELNKEDFLILQTLVDRADWNTGRQQDMQILINKIFREVLE